MPGGVAGVPPVTGAPYADWCHETYDTFIDTTPVALRSRSRLSIPTVDLSQKMFGWFQTDLEQLRDIS